MSGRSRFFLVAIVSGVLGAGCGIDPVSARHSSLQAIPLKTFPRQDWRLPNARFFLWKSGTPAPSMTRALTISTEMDDLDGKAMPLNSRHQELDAAALPLRNSIRQVSGDLIPVKGALSKANQKKTEAETKLSTAKKSLAAEQAKPCPDAALVTQLSAQIAQLETQRQDALGEISDLNPAQDRLQKELTDFRASLQPLQDEMKTLEALQNAITLQGRQLIEELMGIVDWYKNQPSSVTFQFQKNGALDVTISGWDLGDGAGPRELSTQAPAGKKPAIGHPAYEELGGVFTFEASIYRDDSQTSLRETYEFRLGRTKYEVEDGRNFFGGELKRTSYEGGIAHERYGLAQLVDRNG